MGLVQRKMNVFCLNFWDYDLEKLDNEMTNEGMMGTIFGGLAGFALGKSVGKTIAKVLGLKEKGTIETERNELKQKLAELLSDPPVPPVPIKKVSFTEPITINSTPVNKTEPVLAVSEVM